MTTERDPNLLIASWLEEGPRDLPPETRRAIETAVRTMPQRRLGLGPSWRFPTVNGSLRPTLLVAAILISVVGVAVYGRLRPIDPVGGPAVTASPLASVLPSTTPRPTLESIIGRVAFTKYATVNGMNGDNLGTFVGKADGTGMVKLDLPVVSDGVQWSPDGTQLLLGNSPPADGLGWRPAIVRPDGTGYRRLPTPGTFSDMFCSAWSPDGKRLLCAIADNDDPSVAGIVTIDATTGGDMQRLSSNAFPGVKGTKSECTGGDSPGDWSPDGTRVAYVRHRCGTKPDPVQDEQAAVYVTNADGTGTPLLVVSMGGINSAEPQIRWSPDGAWLLFSNGNPALVRPDGMDYRSILTELPMHTYHYSPTWSPDGGRIMFSAWISTSDNTDLWTTDIDGNSARRVTFDAASEDSVSWTR